MKTVSVGLFALGALVLVWGIFKNLTIDGSFGGLGTMAMNTHYILAIALFTGAAAAELIWGERR